MRKIPAIFYFTLFIVFNTFGVEAKQVSAENLLVIPYGTNNSIVYNLRSGTLNLETNHHKIITGAYAAVKNGEQYMTSKDYAYRRVTKQQLNDKIGKGTKYMITLSKNGLPTMQQLFYVYQNQGYFFTEVILKGKALSSNYMAPLIATEADILKKGDNRTLFVPFDNDTFIRYNARPVSEITNTSAEVGAVYENESRAGLVIGSVEHMVWKTGIKTNGTGNLLHQLEIWGGYSEEAVTRDKIPHGSISGDIIKSPKVFAGYFNDWRTGMELYAKANRKLEPPFVFNWTKPTPVGWNSWGVLQDHITYDKLVKVVDFFADSVKTFRSGNTAFIDLDAFWDYITPGGLNGDMEPLKKFVAYCKSKGLQPGVYYAPFTDWGWKSDKPRKVEGADYNYNDIWTKVNGAYHDLDGGRALDPTHPGTQQRIAYTIKKLKDCGFKMIKIDFLAHAAVESSGFFDNNVKTGMQAYKVGMEYLVKQLDGQMLIYAAISPSLASARYVHTRRIACDAFHSMDNIKYTLNSVNYGWWQTYAYNYVDGDHVVFANETAGTNRARLTAGLITGTLITGDDYSTNGPWSGRAKDLLQNPEVLKLVKHGVAFEPVEGNTDDHCGSYFMRRYGNQVYVAVFNFNDQNEDLLMDMKRLGVKLTKNSKVENIYQHTAIAIGSVLSFKLAGHDATILKISL
jgi:alpha-galactosidase